MGEFWRLAEQQGWNDQSVIAVLVGYIENQQSTDALVDYARGLADLENK